jgi:tight adherence protein B
MTLILIATFVGVAALVGGAMLMFAGTPRDNLENRLDILTGSSTAGQRGKDPTPTLLSEPLDKAPPIMDQIMARLGSFSRLLEQSGLKLTATRFTVLTAIAAGLGAGASALFIPWLYTPLAGVVAGSFPLLFVLFMRKRRLGKFGKQLPEALELISRALRAGHSLAAGINLAAEEMPDPIASEFGRCYEEQNFGIPLEQALDEMTERIPNLDLRFFATAVILQRQTGGDLAEILDKIGYLVRERFKIWGAIQALTGEGRLSGIVLLALPPVLFLVMYKLNPDYTMMLFNDQLGQKMLLAAVVMQLLGAYVIRKIIRIKV